MSYLSFSPKRLLAILMSSGLVICLFVLLRGISEIKQPQSQVVTRKIDTVVLPPPPPPPKEAKQKQSQQPTIAATNIQLNTSEAAVQFAQKPDIEAIDIQELKLPEFDFKQVDLSQSIISDFPEVDMKDLDEIPKLLSRVAMRIPRELRSKGVSSVRVVTEILIDENGNAYLRRFIESPYAEMEDVVREFMKTVKFTPPTRNGLPVHAVYTWPLKFTEAR